MNVIAPVPNSSAPSAIQAANLRAYWRASDLALSNGASVSAWNDATANANNLAQATGSAQPTFRTNVFRGKSAVEFATDDYMICDALAALFTGSDKPISCFAIGKLTTTVGGTSQRIFSVARSTNATTFTTMTQVGFSKRDDASLLVNNGGGAVHAGPFVTILSHTGTVSNMRRDGAYMLNAVAQDVATQTENQFTVGARRGSTVIEFLNAYIAELAIWDTTLTLAEMVLMENYANINYF